MQTTPKFLLNDINKVMSKTADDVMSNFNPIPTGLTSNMIEVLFPKATPVIRKLTKQGKSPANIYTGLVQAIVLGAEKEGIEPIEYAFKKYGTSYENATALVTDLLPKHKLAEIEKITGFSLNQLSKAALYADVFNTTIDRIALNYDEYDKLWNDMPETARKMHLETFSFGAFSDTADTNYANKILKEAIVKQQVENDPYFGPFIKNIKKSIAARKAVRPIYTGLTRVFGELGVTIGDMLDWDTIERAGLQLKAVGALTQVPDPSLAEQVLEAYGSTTAFLLTALPAYSLGPAIGLEAGAVNWLAGATSGITEALIEARQTYDELYDLTKSEEKAVFGAYWTMGLNIIWNTIINKVAFFEPLAKTMFGRFATAGFLEAVQEVNQDFIQNRNTYQYWIDKKEFPQYWRTAIVSFLSSGLIGTMLNMPTHKQVRMARERISNDLQEKGVPKEYAETISEGLATEGSLETVRKINEQAEKNVEKRQEQEQAEETLSKVQEIKTKVDKKEISTQEAVEEIKNNPIPTTVKEEAINLIEMAGAEVLSIEDLDQKIAQYIQDENSVEPEVRRVLELQIFGKSTPKVDALTVGELQNIKLSTLKKDIKSIKDPKKRIEALERYMAKKELNKVVEDIGRIEKEANKIANSRDRGLGPDIAHLLNENRKLSAGINPKEAERAIQEIVKRFNKQQYVDLEGTPVYLDVENVLKITKKNVNERTLGELKEYKKALKRIRKIGKDIYNKRIISLTRKEAQKIIETSDAIEAGVDAITLNREVVGPALDIWLQEHNMTWMSLIKGLNLPYIKSKSTLLKYFTTKAKNNKPERVQEVRKRLEKILEIDNLADFVNDVLYRTNKPIKKLDVKKIFRNTRSFITGFHRLVDWVMGTYTTKANKVRDILVDKVHEGFAEYQESFGSRYLNFTQKLAEIFGKGKVAKVLNEKHKVTAAVDGKIITKEFTMSELMGIYAISQTKEGKSALINGHRISEEMIREAIKILPKEAKRVVDETIDELEAKHSEMLYPVFERTGYVLGRVMRYFRLQRNVTVSEYGTVELHDLLGVPKEHLQSPKDRRLSPEMPRETLGVDQAPVNLDFFDVAVHTFEIQERIINLGQVTRQVNDIITDKRFQKAIKVRYGDGVLNAFKKYSDLIMSPHQQYTGDTASRWLRQVRHRLSVAVLAGNLKSVLNQFYSIFLAVPYVNTPGTLLAVSKIMASPLKIRNEVLNKSKIAKYRSYNLLVQELKELQQLSTDEQGRIRYEMIAMGLQRIADRMTVTVAWYAAYQSALLKGATEEEAIKHADTMLRNTQPLPWTIAQTRSMTAPEIGGEVFRSLQAFSGQKRQTFDMMMIDVPNAFLAGDYKEAFEAIFGILASYVALIYTAYKAAGGVKDIIKAMPSTIGNTIPIISSLFSFYHSPMFGGGTLLEYLQKATNNLFEGKMADFFLKLGEMVLAYEGAPVVAIKRGVKAYQTGKLSDLTGVKKRTVR